MESLQRRKVLVVGDVMLDQYIHCEMIKISAEAPVPVVRRQRKEDKLGGAANVAANISSLGASVDLIGVLGNDVDGDSVVHLLEKYGVGTSYLHRSKTFQTICKQRILVNRQQLLRVDNESNLPFLGDDIFRLFQEVVERYDIIVLSDYGKGVLRNHKRYISLAKRNKINVLVDPKGDDYSGYQGAFIVTPNLSELEAIVGKCENLGIVVERAKDLRISLDINNLVVTLGSSGMLLVNENEVIHIETDAREVFDVSGAGDTVLASLAVFLESFDTLLEVCTLANTAAGIAVSKHGTSVVSLDELKQRIDIKASTHEGLLSELQVKKIIERAKLEGKSVVMTNGCFDILHEGHVSYLKGAKSLGSLLIVALNSDASVRKLKGASRPINGINARAAIVRALESVDYVVSFDDDTPLDLYKKLLPDVLVKGGDYQVEEIIGSKEIIANGGRVTTIPFLDGYSTSSIVSRIQINE
jgi:D-beta-D-heptose 7-phosphate kinase / D-beta-D-heptose 1-phosphate adenosyltransferase